LQKSLQQHRVGGESSDLKDLDELSLSSLSIAIKRDIAFDRVPVTERELLASLKAHGNIDAMVADVLNNLAACHEVLGQFAIAQRLYQEGLELRQIVFGPQSLKVAESMQNLATILDSQGRYAEAESLLSDALLIQVRCVRVSSSYQINNSSYWHQRRELGEDHVEIAVTLNNLGVLLAHLGYLQRSEMLLRESVRIRRAVYGEHHHLTLGSEQNLDFVSLKRRRFEALEREMSDSCENQDHCVKNTDVTND
jgi:tetratricopeptide (TPR) repeat protein